MHVTDHAGGSAGHLQLLRQVAQAALRVRAALRQRGRLRGRGLRAALGCTRALGRFALRGCCCVALRGQARLLVLA